MMDLSVATNGPRVASPEWVEQRRANVARFLAQRDLDFPRLEAFMRERVGDGELLLTSSPVHGLSNPTSDLDFIRVQRDLIEGARISTKIFDRGHHLEVVSFSRSEIARNLAELQSLSAGAPEAIVAGFRSWDHRLEPRRKQTERVVNGITADGQMPYLAHLPALSIVWSHASLQTAIEQVLHLCLAETAGEARGRVGYAYNAVLHLMDALLSHTGDVYTTRKWFLLRWTRRALGGPDPADLEPELRSAAEAVDRLRRGLAGALDRPPEPLGPGYVEACLRVARIVAGVDRIAVSTEVDGDVDFHRFLPGAGLLSRSTAGIVVPGECAPDPLEAPLERVPEVSVDQATAMLRAVRTGLATTRISYRRAVPA